MTVQLIRSDGEPEWAVVPYKTYLQLVEKAEMLQDVQDYDSVKNALDQGKDELIPGDIVYAILDGENPIKTWREYRGMSQHALAGMAGISIPYLSQLETNKRKGSLEVFTAISKALKVTLDDLAPSQE